MLHAPRRFTDEEIAVLTICERNGWTYADWHALSDDEQTDRLAFQYRRTLFLDSIEDMFDTRIADEKPIEQTAYTLMLLHRMMG